MTMEYAELFHDLSSEVQAIAERQSSAVIGKVLLGGFEKFAEHNADRVDRALTTRFYFDLAGRAQEVVRRLEKDPSKQTIKGLVATIQQVAVFPPRLEELEKTLLLVIPHHHRETDTIDVNGVIQSYRGLANSSFEFVLSSLSRKYSN